MIKKKAAKAGGAAARKAAVAREAFFRKLGWDGRAKFLGVCLVSALVFFATVFSDLGLYPKVILALAELAATGIILQRMTGWEGWMGLLLVRGKKGFGFMHYIGEHYPDLCRGIADYGLALCFGLPYSWYVFRGQNRKLALHAALQIVLAWFVADGAKFYFPPIFTAALVIIAGLMGFGYALITLQAVKILTVPKTPAGVMPVIPGVTIPLVEGIIAIAIVATVHELAHGIISVIEKIELKASGIVLLGFLPVGAFVEPDEAKFKNADIMKKRRVLVAGSMSNFIFFIVFLGLLQLAVGAAAFSTGSVSVNSVLANSTAFGTLSAGEKILSVNGTPVKTTFDLGNVLSGFSEGQSVPLVTSAGAKQVLMGQGGRLGIMVENIPALGWEWLFGLSAFLVGVFQLTSLLSFAISLFNILPIFITDGHQIVAAELSEHLGRKKEGQAKLLAKAIGLTSLAILLVNLLPWFM